MKDAAHESTRPSINTSNTAIILKEISPSMITKAASWGQVTPFLVFCVVAYSWGDLMFGIDTGSFGAMQVLPSWLRSFGDYNPETGVYSSPTTRTSIMNSVVFAGKLVGTMLFEPVAERLGYKYTMYIAATIQCVALVVELTAKDWIVFTVGRVIAYLGVGMVENCVPSYISEICPAGVRGFMSGTLTVLVSLGNLWGVGMSRAFANETRRVGWIVPVAVQFIPAVGMFVFVPLTPESPRWLVLKGRNEEAVRALNRVRPREEVQSGMTHLEVEAFEQAVLAARERRDGRWTDLARGTFRRRTIIVSLMFWFYQSTGVQFVNTYGPTFYRQMGLGAQAFTYSALAQMCGIIATIINISITDKVGRRPPVIVGAAGCVLFNALIAGLASKQPPSESDVNMVIASVMLVLASSKMFQCQAFMGYGTSVDVISAFIVTFTLPYLLNASGANLGPKVGWILMGDSVFSLIFAGGYLPELAGRSLEEMDELFGMRLWAWQFKKAQTQGVGRRVAELEAGRAIGMDKDGEKREGGETEMIEDVKDVRV